MQPNISSIWSKFDIFESPICLNAEIDKIGFLRTKFWKILFYFCSWGADPIIFFLRFPIFAF